MAANTLTVPHEAAVANDLRRLTRALATSGHRPTQGLLGGEDGYGTHYTGPVFSMRPYFWGDCDPNACGHEAADIAWHATNSHAPECYQSRLLDNGYAHHDDPRFGPTQGRERKTHNDPIVRSLCLEMGLDPHYGALVHCTCDFEARHQDWDATHHHHPECGVVAPNFRHHPTGSEVRWYKHIGRSMELDIHAQWEEIINDCLSSLGTNNP